MPPHLAETGLRLGRAFAIARPKQGVTRLRERLVETFVTGEDLREAEAKQETGPLSVVLGPQLERFGKVMHSRGEGVQRIRALACIAQRHTRRSRQITEVAPCGACIVDRREIVVREHLGVILGTAERLDPLGGQPVFFGAISAWDLTVSNVAHEQMTECVLLVLLDR
jgi:hypothetical protein